ncbi:MAG: TRAP transporter substrate-binding protein [Thermoleophilia bacterium]|nr:TRAP transporter substrate-binding protein [Thermoleophilia bacterium]
MNTRSWVWRIGMIVAALALALGVAACGDDDDDGGDTTEAATDVAEANLTLAYVTTEQHPYGVAVNNFAEEVATASGGAITITGQPSFPGDIPLLADVRSGTVEMATVSSAVWDNAGVDAFQALQALFLITNLDIEKAVLSNEDGTGLGEIAQDMLTQMEEDTGDLKGLAIHEGGLRSPLGRAKPLVSPADFDGLKIRAVESKVMAEGLKALGAEPTPLPLPDVFQALQNGTVDGMEANTGLTAGQKYYEVAEFFTGDVVFWPFPTVMVINKDVWDGLDETQQQIIADAAAKTPGFIIDRLSGGADPFAQPLANCGLEFVEATDEDKAALEEAGQSAVTALSEANESTGEFITQIQEVKDGIDEKSAPVVTATAEEGAACELG